MIIIVAITIKPCFFFMVVVTYAKLNYFWRSWLLFFFSLFFYCCIPLLSCIYQFFWFFSFLIRLNSARPEPTSLGIVHALGQPPRGSLFLFNFSFLQRLIFLEYVSCVKVIFIIIICWLSSPKFFIFLLFQLEWILVSYRLKFLLLNLKIHSNVCL